MWQSHIAKPIEAKAKQDSSIVFIVENFTKFDSLKQIFKGRIVYVDIWATWCSPCRREFKYYQPLQEFAKSNNIALLYISGDKYADEPKWKATVKKYNLSGYHIRMNNALKTDIKQKFARPLKSSGELALVYPTYIILDKFGNVFENVPKPSNYVELLRKLEKLDK